jgi:Phospholipase_D-nuclease N-terminal
MSVSIISVLPFLVCGIILIAIVSSVFWVWAIVDCATHEPANSNDKIIWVLVILFMHFIGALLYYLVRRPERLRQFGR